MSEAEQAAEQHSARQAVLDLIEAAYGDQVVWLRRMLLRQNRRLARFQTNADSARALITAALERAAAEWDEVMDDLRLPVADGQVIAWTKQRSPEELILNIGDDEWFVINGGETHWYGPARDAKGTRRCYICSITVVIPTVSLGVIPGLLPQNVREAIEEEKA